MQFRYPQVSRQFLADPHDHNPSEKGDDRDRDEEIHHEQSLEVLGRGDIALEVSVDLEQPGPRITLSDSDQHLVDQSLRRLAAIAAEVGARAVEHRLKCDLMGADFDVQQGSSDKQRYRTTGAGQAKVQGLPLAHLPMSRRTLPASISCAISARGLRGHRTGSYADCSPSREPAVHRDGGLCICLFSPACQVD